MNVPSYREIAERSLAQAAGLLNALPQGSVRVDEMTARSTQAHAVAALAIAQALIEIGDVLRSALAPEHGVRG